MNTLLLFLGLTFSPSSDLAVQQQPVPTTRPAQPKSRTTSSPVDTIGRRRDRKPRPDSLRRAGASRIDSVRRR
ncbi:hypothetical protein [Fibrella forsythiae]|uniref:Uncharacterized protein n=1 Tax=Fibrella forsythiae TaxID=2817061 RepID=A0ABS3JHV2_9BACT|nr:hypothetical protein [Fibrella forsythiae]MBO0949597.1 hypothetical protein [Fibrella forsythiae]